MTGSSILGITLDVFSSPKSVRNYSSHQNRWGETCYIVVTNKMFFSVIKSVLKSSLNSVQSYRNKKSGSKMSLNSVKKNVIHREGRRSVHWIRWQKRKFTEFSDEFFTGGYSAHIWLDGLLVGDIGGVWGWRDLWTLCAEPTSFLLHEKERPHILKRLFKHKTVF